MYEVVLRNNKQVEWENVRVKDNGWIICWDNNKEGANKHVWYPSQQVVRVEEL